jgi:adenylosuccinate synthase
MKEKEKSLMYLLKIRYYCSFSRGPNAGHTLEFDGIKHVLRTIPSGIFTITLILLEMVL